MLTEHIKNALISNWGDRAEAMDCYCEVKYIDSMGFWKVYIYALDPNDEDSIKCICDTLFGAKLIDWSLTDLLNCFNENGEHVYVDPEFRRIKADILYKKLRLD